MGKKTGSQERRGVGRAEAGREGAGWDGREERAPRELDGRDREEKGNEGHARNRGRGEGGRGARGRKKEMSSDKDIEKDAYLEKNTSLLHHWLCGRRQGRT